MTHEESGDDWRAHVGEPNEHNAIDLVRAGEPGRGRDARLLNRFPSGMDRYFLAGLLGLSEKTAFYPLQAAWHSLLFWRFFPALGLGVTLRTVCRCGHHRRAYNFLGWHFTFWHPGDRR